MEKIFIEVGSTVVKADKYNGKDLEKLEGITIPFKKHFKEENKLRESDIDNLIKFVIDKKNITDNIYVCGTSIFRSLSDDEKNKFLSRFKEETGYDFDIISQDEENDLTVYGATRNITSKSCVFIGGGGSTEISIYDEGIKETVNTEIGVIDIMEVFPDLALDTATTDLKEVMDYIKERLNLPKEKSDILILAGGAHKYFAENSGVHYEKNTLYNDSAADIMMDIDTRKKETIRYYKEISLDEIRSRVKDPKWWYATRAMCAFVLVVAETIGAKYIVPTDIAMIYGLLNKGE